MLRIKRKYIVTGFEEYKKRKYETRKRKLECNWNQSNTGYDIYNKKTKYSVSKCLIHKNENICNIYDCNGVFNINKSQSMASYLI